MYRENNNLDVSESLIGDHSENSIQYTPGDLPSTTCDLPPGNFGASPMRKRGRTSAMNDANFDRLMIQSQDNASQADQISTSHHQPQQQQLQQQSRLSLAPTSTTAATATATANLITKPADTEQKVTLRSVVNHFLPGVAPKLTSKTIWLGNALDKPRYHWDFNEEGELGRGQHSSVFVARHRLDGSLYAIKKLKMHLDEERPTFTDVREVCANVALKGCPHLVQYFGSWIEDQHLWIQLELCLRVNLDIFITPILFPEPPGIVRIPSSWNSYCDMEESYSQGTTISEEKSTPLKQQPSSIKNENLFSEKSFWKVLYSISSALEFIHSKYLAHMDIRPANMFITPSIPSVDRIPTQTKPAFPPPPPPPPPAFSDYHTTTSTTSTTTTTTSQLKRKLSFPPVFLPPPAPLPNSNSNSKLERTFSDCESAGCLTQHSLNDQEIFLYSSQCSNPPAYGLAHLSVPCTPIEELPPLVMSQQEASFETHRQKTSETISARDVNDNLSNDHWEIKLGDLGLCCRCDDYSSFTEGEDRYCALELIQGSIGSLDLAKADIFSLGASLVEMCLGRGLSLSGDEWLKLRDGRFQQILNEYESVTGNGGSEDEKPMNPSYVELMSYSQEARGILKQMLSTDHTQRPTATYLKKYSLQQLNGGGGGGGLGQQGMNEEDTQLQNHQVILTLHERIRELEGEVESLKKQKRSHSQYN